MSLIKLPQSLTHKKLTKIDALLISAQFVNVVCIASAVIKPVENSLHFDRNNTQILSRISSNTLLAIKINRNYILINAGISKPHPRPLSRGEGSICPLFSPLSSGEGSGVRLCISKYILPKNNLIYRTTNLPKKNQLSVIKYSKSKIQLGFLNHYVN